MLATVHQAISTSRWGRLGVTGVLVCAFGLLLTNLVQRSQVDQIGTVELKAALAEHDKHQEERAQQMQELLRQLIASQNETARVQRVMCVGQAHDEAGRENCRGGNR